MTLQMLATEEAMEIVKVPGFEYTKKLNLDEVCHAKFRSP